MSFLFISLIHIHVIIIQCKVQKFSFSTSFNNRRSILTHVSSLRKSLSSYFFPLKSHNPFLLFLSLSPSSILSPHPLPGYVVHLLLSSSSSFFEQQLLFPIPHSLLTLHPLFSTSLPHHFHRFSAFLAFFKKISSFISGLKVGGGTESDNWYKNRQACWRVIQYSRVFYSIQ